MKTRRLGFGEVEASGVEPVLTSEMLAELRQRLRQSEAREALLDAPSDEDTIVMSRADLPLARDPLRPRLGGSPGFDLDWDAEDPTRLGPPLSASAAESVLASASDPAGARFAEPPTPERARALPTRTWILLVVTVLVTVGWLVTDEPAEPPPEPTVEEQMRDEARAAREADRAGAQHAATDIDAAPSSEGPQDTLTVTAPAEHPAEGASRDRRTLQARAADAYRTGRHEEALRLYRALATEQPDQRAYTFMVRVLSRELGVPTPGGASIAEAEREPSVSPAGRDHSPRS